jgi:hypothetical protein
VRVYLPATLPALAAVLGRGALGSAPLPAHAVTPALREWYAEGDLEELEYAAMQAAAQASLRRLAADPSAPRRRVVLAADVPDAAVTRAPAAGRSAVTVSADVLLTDIASAHVDLLDAEPDVAAACAALPAADRGDEDAAFTVDGAAGHELAWYAPQELPDLLQG